MQAVRIRVRAESYDELAILARRAQALTNASGTAIALNEGNAGETICRARAGSNAPEVGTALPDETFTGLCIRSGKELRCDDAETDSRVDKAAIRALGIRSMVAVPIKEEGRVVGVLAVFAANANAFGNTHVLVLKTMANQIADYLHRTLCNEACSPEPLPVPPVKAAAVSSAAPPMLPPPVIIKAAAPKLTHRQLPLVAKAEPVRATTLAKKIDPAPSGQKPSGQKPSGQKKETIHHDERKESQTDFRRVLGSLFRRVFGSLDAAAIRKNRLASNVLMIGAAAMVIIAVAFGFSSKLRRPAAAPQPALETSSLPGTPAARAPAFTNAQPPANNTPPAPPAEHGKTQPKRKEIVVLSAGPSRISEARDDSAPTSDAPAISLGDGPASGSLSDLVNPVSQPANPQLLTESAFEPVTAIKKVPPVYPLIAKLRRLRGSVVVQGTVDKNGRISDLQLISGSPRFRDAAFAAVKQWVFKPARLNGHAIEHSTTIRIDFGAQ